ncbi:MAG: Lrp/AsnC ligand binding domain-containing protein [Bacteroidales bacterium]|nr:Lrp/AsnC ligand binding domain-containing protein [Bacteroidales bacterium]
MKTENYTQIDKLDRKILSILTRNARIPFLEVARECNVSGAAIHQRVQRLTKIGIISGSQFIVEPKKLGYHTCAYIGIFLDNAALFADVSERLFKIPEITQCHYTTGQYAMFVKVFAKDNEHLRKVLAEKIQAINGIMRTETFISLEVMVDRQLPIIEETSEELKTGDK